MALKYKHLICLNGEEMFFRDGLPLHTRSSVSQSDILEIRRKTTQSSGELRFLA